MEVRAGDQDEPVVAAYTYGPAGRRIKKVVENSGDLDTTEYYYYAGQQMIETRNGTGDATRQFVFGTQYVDEPIRMDVDTGDDGNCTDGSSRFYYYHQDANYNVVALTDDTAGMGYAGDVAQFYLYDAYGRLHPYATADGTAAQELLLPILEPAAGVEVPNPFTYAGRFHDVETGLYYYRARHYHASLGRFAQRDPLAFVANQFDVGAHYLDGTNLYDYGRSSPLKARDPLGMFDISGIGKLIPSGLPCGSITFTAKPQVINIKYTDPVPKGCDGIRDFGKFVIPGMVTLEFQKYFPMTRSIPCPPGQTCANLLPFGPLKYSYPFIVARDVTAGGTTAPPAECRVTVLLWIRQTVSGLVGCCKK